MSLPNSPSTRTKAKNKDIMELENRQFRQLSPAESYLLIAGCLLMVAGTGCFVFMFQQFLAGCAFLIGSILFAVQCLQVYTGSDITLRRLKSIMNLANLMFILAGVLMVDTAVTNRVLQDPLGGHHRFLSNMFANWETYIECVYNKWIALLLIAVVLELYTTHRISSELKKKATKSDDGKEKKV